MELHTVMLSMLVLMNEGKGKKNMSQKMKENLGNGTA